MGSEPLLALRSTVRTMEVEEGAFISDGRSEILFSRPGLFPVILKLCASLNGELTLGAITEGVPARVRPLLDELIGALDARGMLQRLAAPAVNFRDLMADPHRGVLLFLRDREPHFASEFEGWRNLSLAIVGAGHTLKAAARNFARLGIERICLHIVSGREVSEAEVTQGVNDHYETMGRGELKVVDREGFAAAISPDGLLVYASDNLRADMDFPPPSHVSGARLALASGVMDGVGLVVPLRHESDVLALRSRLRGANARPHSITSRALIGSVTALQALSLTAISSRRSGDGPALPLLKIDAGGHVTQHQLCDLSNQSPEAIARLAISAKESRGGADARGAEGGEIFDTLFDPVIGPFEWIPVDPDDELPLAHQAIDLRVPREDRVLPERVTGWGRELKDARGDALARAAARYAEQVESGRSGADPRPITAATDYADWKQKACAYAFTASLPFQAGLQVRAVDPQRAVDLEIPWYLRLINIYGQCDASAWIGQSSQCPGVLAYAQAGSLEASGAGLTHEEALHAALGDLCNGVVAGARLPDTPATCALDLARQFPLLASPTVLQLSELPPVLTVDAAEVGTDELFTGDPVLALAGLWVGRVSLDAAVGARSLGYAR
jgi:hypothetical protein